MKYLWRLNGIDDIVTYSRLVMSTRCHTRYPPTEHDAFWKGFDCWME